MLALLLATALAAPVDLSAPGATGPHLRTTNGDAVAVGLLAGSTLGLTLADFGFNQGFLKSPDRWGDRDWGTVEGADKVSDLGLWEVPLRPSHAWDLYTDIALVSVPLLALAPMEGGSPFTRRAAGRTEIVGESVLAATLLTTVLKKSVRRRRPWASASDPEHTVACDGSAQRCFDTRDAFYSFPSGHTSIVTSAATSWAMTWALGNAGGFWRGNRFLAPAGALLLGASVGYGRVRASDHFPTDVAVGWLIGAAAGIALPLAHLHGGSEEAGLSVGAQSLSFSAAW